MATKTPKAPTTQLNSWEAELAKSATIAAKAESKSVERVFLGMGNGQMSFQGAPVPNNELPAIVLGDIHANLYYPGAYDSSNPVPPECYAYARTNDQGELEGVDTWDGRKEMAPHKDCATRCHTDCATCPMNQWASAAQGKGKACQNTRRIAMIPGGTFINGRFEPYTTPAQIDDAQLAYLKLPVMSVKGFAAYVTQTASALQRPLWGVFSKLKRVPSASQYTAQWEALGLIPNALMDSVFKRVKVVAEDILFPFQPKTAGAEVTPLKTKKPMRKYS